MLKSFRISNFRSLVNVEFRPVGSNLLIGPNNAGKTNLCSALRFLSLAASTNLETAAQNAVGETWNIANAYVSDRTLQLDVTATLEDGGQSLDFDYTLQIAVQKDSASLGVSLHARKEQLLITGGRFTRTVLLTCTNEQAELLHEEQFLQGTTYQARTLSPSDATMLSRLYDLQSNRRANLFKRYLQSWMYFNLNPHAMRSHRVVSERAIIYPDGSNLSKVMFALHNERPRVERKVIESLRLIEPKVDLFTFTSPDPQSAYLFLEDQEQNRFGTKSMSDGTLRYLVFAYLVYSLAEAKASTPFAPLIMIEEPEDGLYVGQLRPLFEKIDASGASGQFLFTSHSPYFIDLFERNLSGVHLMKPGKPSSVLVIPDPAKIGKLLEQMPLGELYFREMLT
jgi:predicted ATPase